MCVILGLSATPAAIANSSSSKSLRFTVVKRTPHFVIIKRHSHRYAVRRGRHEVTLKSTRHHRYRVVKRTRRYIFLRPVSPSPMPTPAPTPTVTPTPVPTPTVTPTPTPTPTVTPTPTPTPTVTPTPGPVHPGLILTQTDIDAIRARLSAGQQPQTDAWNVFLSSRVKPALSGAPAVFAGPLTSGGVSSALELALDKDGAAARNLGLAYVFTSDPTYAQKSRDYLVAWAKGNTPTAYDDCGDKWAGSYQAHGAFMFAYAYDLIYDSGVLTAADKTASVAGSSSFVDALDTYNTQLRSEWVITHPTYELPYVWDATKHYNVYDNYVGGDMALLQQTARLAMAHVIGYSAAENSILNDSSNILGLESMSKCSLRRATMAMASLGTRRRRRKSTCTSSR